MQRNSNYKHWDLRETEDKLLWLGIDRQSSAVNTIDYDVLRELEEILSNITESSGLVIYSAKAKDFVVGTDLQYLIKLKSKKQILEFYTYGQKVFNQLESLTIPTIAIIEGLCMGGGTELTLACDYRIAINSSNSSGTEIGLPEVLFGLHPGWGGTVRLPKLIGGFQAIIKVILAGESIPAKDARKIGLVDTVVDKQRLEEVVQFYVNKRPAKQRRNFFQSVADLKVCRMLLGWLIKAKLNQKIKSDHYPAPYTVLDNWVNMKVIAKEAQIYEARSVSTLLTESDTANNLIRAYFLRERLQSFTQQSDFKARTVHVIGTGVMGGDIAAWCALNGLQVTLQSRSYKNITSAVARAYKFFDKKLKKKQLIQEAMDRLTPDIEGGGISTADVIIEAVVENETVKQDLFQSLERKASKTALLVTNTSSILLETIAEKMVQPARLVGLHFFNPVAEMPLVEVVRSKYNTAQQLEQASAFVGQLAKLPLPVLGTPGFLINRVSMPYFMECGVLLDEGVAAEVIDEVAENFGMFIGPIELADTIGLDVCLAAAGNLAQYYDGEISQKLRDKVAAGKLGKKTSEGFYKYRRDKKIAKRRAKVTELIRHDIWHRLLSRLLNEAAACVREGVVADRDLLDAGLIFGFGFPPYIGDSINYAKRIGVLKELDSG